jgi:hypothetical protein
MALQGSLRDFSTTEILQLLGSQKKTGALTLENGSEKGIVFVQEGRVVSTRLPGMTKDDPLLGFLRQIHRLSDEQLSGVLTIQRESGRDLEDLLLNGRYLDSRELTMFIERQVLDDLMRLVRWDNGSYRFDPNTKWPNTPLVLLSMEGVMIEAAGARVNVDVDRPRVAVRAVAPHRAQQLLAAERDHRALHQRVQQLELREREPDRLAVAPDHAGRVVEHDRARPQHRLAQPLSPRAPEHRAHAAAQLGEAERLGDIVVGASIERLDFGLFLALNGQHNDGNLG